MSHQIPERGKVHVLSAFSLQCPQSCNPGPQPGVSTLTEHKFFGIGRFGDDYSLEYATISDALFYDCEFWVFVNPGVGIVWFDQGNIDGKN